MLLVGNTFPMTLIRRHVEITPIDLAEAKLMVEKGIKSFWGHKNTIAVAEQQLGVNVAPESERPALSLSNEGFPMLDGEVFSQVLILNPLYVSGFRPQIGETVPPDKFIGWHALLIKFD